MLVKVEFEYVTLENEEGHEVDSVVATCSRCGHTVESYGEGDDSKRRCLALLKEECPCGESNFYFDEDDPPKRKPTPRKPPSKAKMKRMEITRSKYKKVSNK